MPEKPQYVPITLALQKVEAGRVGTQGYSWLHPQLHSMLRSQPGIRLYKEKKAHPFYSCCNNLTGTTVFYQLRECFKLSAIFTYLYHL